MACSDSLGGLAQYPCFMNELRATQGVLVQMKQRAQLYSSRQLAPHFTTEKWEPTLACMYTDETGGVYRYCPDDQVHRMVGPDGRGLHERVTGRNQFATELSRPGWPAYGEGTLLALDPAEGGPASGYLTLLGDRFFGAVMLNETLADSTGARTARWCWTSWCRCPRATPRWLSTSATCSRSTGTG